MSGDSGPPPAPRVAVVAARWHGDIVGQAVQSCESRLAESGITEVETLWVPGAFEIPLLVRRLALSGQFSGIAAVALVVDGGIYRHEFVATTVVDALMRIQLETDVPVFSGVLTPHHFHEHAEHDTQFYRHFVTKGRELAEAMVSTLAILSSVPR